MEIRAQFRVEKQEYAHLQGYPSPGSHIIKK